ncbi:MAG TPA: PIG-L family deacetylase [Solirubrobacteraceae bacterium]|jgi:LmbE family N-acetylglucosaminyl deacetylase/CheY-like chemotaxis protein|nr:PIG-L family deacetylase [Solirubrobacteraceae bacterium]
MSTQQRRLRILLVEDDAIFAAVTAEVMRERALVRWTPTAESAIAAAGEKDWDLIITDIELPGMSGLELVMKIKAAQPHVATLILTGHRSFDNAVEAIRVGADDFLTKPVDRRTLIEKIDELAALSARRKAASSAAVLAIGAHPDDVEVGAGGTLLGHVAQGHEVSILVLTGGETGGIPAERAREAGRAAELMGVRLFHVNLADSSVSEGGATIGEITRVIEELSPDTIYTPSGHDLNQDHRNVHHATSVAAQRVPRVFCYQTPSSTVEFRPTRFVPVDEFMDRKLAVIRSYTSQVKQRRYLDAELLRATSRYWSRYGHSRFVEPFEVARDAEGEATLETEHESNMGALLENA